MKKLFAFSLALFLLVGVFAGPATFVSGPSINVQAETLEPSLDSGNDGANTLSPISIGGS